MFLFTLSSSSFEVKTNLAHNSLKNNMPQIVFDNWAKQQIYFCSNIGCHNLSTSWSYWHRCLACKLLFPSLSISNIIFFPRKSLTSYLCICLSPCFLRELWESFTKEHFALCKICSNGRFIFRFLCSTFDKPLKTNNALGSYNCNFFHFF